MSYKSKHTGATIDRQIDRVLDGSVVVENTLSALDETSDKPVSGKGVATALEDFAAQQQLTEMKSEVKMINSTLYGVSEFEDREISFTKDGFRLAETGVITNSVAEGRSVDYYKVGGNTRCKLTISANSGSKYNALFGSYTYDDIDYISAFNVFSEDRAPVTDFEAEIVTPEDCVYLVVCRDTSGNSSLKVEQNAKSSLLGQAEHITNVVEGTEVTNTEYAKSVAEGVRIPQSGLSTIASTAVNYNTYNFPVREGKTYTLTIPSLTNKYTPAFSYHTTEVLDGGVQVTVPEDAIYGPISDFSAEVVIPTGIKYLIVCTEKTSEPPYITYTTSEGGIVDEIEKIKEEQDKLETHIDVILPNNVDIVYREKIHLYYRSLVKTYDVYGKVIKPICDIGRAYPRSYYHYATSGIGEVKGLKVKVEDSKGNIFGESDTNIKIIPAMESPSSQINVLCIGASLMSNGSIVNELRRRLVDTSGTFGDSSNPEGLGLSNISFVGRKVGTVYNDVHLEATGGWSWAQYASSGRAACRFFVSGIVQISMGDVYTDGTNNFTIAEINVTNGEGNIRCLGASSATNDSGVLTRVSGSGDETINYSSFASETFSPFYVNGEIDFIEYANDYCNGSIDVIVSVCGTNDIFTTTSLDLIFEQYIKPFVRKYHEQFPNGKFLFSTLPLPDMYGGMGANYGASNTSNYWDIAKRTFEFAKLAYAMEREDEFSSYFKVANTLQLCDSENIYQYTQAPVGNRMPDMTEKLGLNGVHAQGSSSVGTTITGGSEAGTKSIADALFQSFNAMFVE